MANDSLSFGRTFVAGFQRRHPAVGGNSTILHWPVSFRQARAGEVVLMDVAA